MAEDLGSGNWYPSPNRNWVPNPNPNAWGRTGLGPKRHGKVDLYFLRCQESEFF